jgi:hypothetical protein
MERENNFKRLFEEEEMLCPPAPENISHRLTGSMNTYRMIGQFTELFIPTLGGVMLGLTNQPSARPDEDSQMPNNGYDPHGRGDY